MSWLNIAKNALREAQLKIDQVLDIQDDDEDEIMKDKDETVMTISSDKTNHPIVKSPSVEHKNLTESQSGTFSNIENLADSSYAGKISNSSSAATINSVDSQLLLESTNKNNLQDSNEQQQDIEKSMTIDDNNSLTFSETNTVISKSDTILTLDTSMLSDYVQIPDNINDKILLSEEVETTTSSSDIEIISNPNGDSSSTNSICRGGSPIIVKSSQSNKRSNSKKRHCRESSEISIQSEDSQSETDKLMIRISELNEIIEIREMRLLEVSRQNSALIEKTAEYAKQVEAKQQKKEYLETEETQRLSSLEKKYQISIRERDSLREQLNALSIKIPKDDLNKIINEKDIMIDELRNEGDKLSKQILQHSDIIKKLRTKEKDNLNSLKRNKEQIETLTDEVDRLKKSLTAKDELERTQIDAVHKLSSTKRKLDQENFILKSQMEDLNSKLLAVQKSFDAAKIEVLEKQQTYLELSKKAQIADSLEHEKKHTQNQNQEIMLQLEELRHGIKSTDTDNSLRERKLRTENSELLQRLELAELRAEKLTNELSMATVPLAKQLERLQETLSKRTKSWEKHEEDLVLKIKSYQDDLEKLNNIEKKSIEKQNNLNSQMKSLEERLQISLIKSEEENSQIQEKEFKFNMEISEYKKKIYEYENKLGEYGKLIDELKAKNQQNQLDLGKNKLILDDDGNYQEQNTSTLEVINNQQQQILTNDNHSPPISLGQNSLSESLHSAGWQMDDLEVISDRRDLGSMCYNLGQSAAVYENLQASLKQKDGEISQLQWELSRLHTERNFLNNEVSKLTLEMIEIKEKLQSNGDIEIELNELKSQYDALLQMYGEKVEETQELKLDLQDVKMLYKGQIDELLKQSKNSSQV